MPRTQINGAADIQTGTIPLAGLTAAAQAALLTTANLVSNETPGGTVNGTNTAFTLAFTPSAGTLNLYQNGLLQEPGSGNDYTLSGAAITMLSAPPTGAKLRATYFKS